MRRMLRLMFLVLKRGQPIVASDYQLVHDKLRREIVTHHRYYLLYFEYGLMIAGLRTKYLQEGI